MRKIYNFIYNQVCIYLQAYINMINEVDDAFDYYEKSHRLYKKR